MNARALVCARISISVVMRNMLRDSLVAIRSTGAFAETSVTAGTCERIYKLGVVQITVSHYHQDGIIKRERSSRY